jgi:dihydroorotase
MTIRQNEDGGYSVPAFIDMHCHLREPGFEYKEDIESGTAAAKAGGYCAVVSMPNTRPVTDNTEILEYIIKRASETGHCAVYPTAAITVGQKGETLCDFTALAACGAAAFTDDGRPVENSAVMLEAMYRCASLGLLIISHCEELGLSAGVMNEGEASRRLGLRGTSNAAEDVMTARDIVLSEQTGCRLHIAHVSTRGSLQLIREAKARGVRVTAETCPHYFSLCDEDVGVIGVNAKMNPPLRTRDDVTAVIKALSDGTLDCISTDHAPHSEKEKGSNLKTAPNGIIGLQTAFAAAITYLVRPGHITLKRLCELMSENPAKILGIGLPEKTVTVYPDRKFIFTSDMIISKSKNSPFIGRELYGTVKI